MSLIKSQLIQNITDANPHLFVRDVERIVNTIFNEIEWSFEDLEHLASNIEKLALEEIQKQVRQLKSKKNSSPGLKREKK